MSEIVAAAPRYPSRFGANDGGPRRGTEVHFIIFGQLCVAYVLPDSSNVIMVPILVA